ncbi:MAG TPA: FtsX-like permease family protein, partial [Vicinamibacterales bacterium]|nr:FtsX-like permease family protein [Vicinamibacterales bacterium]
RPMVRYYTSSQGEPAFSALIVLRTADDASTAISDLERAVKAIDPRVSSGPWLTMEQQLGRQMNPQRFGIFVLGSLAVIALVLTGLGIYVVAASMAAGRRREMTIRSALGASRASIGGLIVRETAWLVGGGTAGGLMLAWSGARTIRTLLFRVEPLDPLTIVATVASVILVSLLVTLRPAVGAGRCDLAQVLREE